MKELDGRDLDRHITGNWGEDQFAGTDADENEEYEEPECVECGFRAPLNDEGICEGCDRKKNPDDHANENPNIINCWHCDALNWASDYDCQHCGEEIANDGCDSCDRNWGGPTHTFFDGNGDPDVSICALCDKEFREQQEREFYENHDPVFDLEAEKRAEQDAIDAMREG